MAKVQPIIPSAVKRAEHGRTVYSVTLEDGVTIADVQKSDFWVHLANRFEQWDRIEVVPEDGGYFAELVVSRVDKITEGTRTIRVPHFALLNKVDISTKTAKPAKAEKSDDDEDEGTIPEGYQVAYGGPKYKWRVIQDGVADPIADGMSKKDAIAWVQAHADKIDA